MELDFALIFELIKRLVLMIFEKYEVIKEFEDLGIDIVGLLNGMSDTPDTPSPDGRTLH